MFEDAKMTKNRLAKKNNNLGFTLVELIVVLVILAVLAAILIPALLGWIDRAREKKTLLNAKNCLTAIQVQLAERYGKNGGSVPEGRSILYVETADPNAQQVDYWISKTFPQNSNGDVNATRQTDNKDKTKTDNFATPILKTLESARSDKDKKSDPYCIIFGVGSNAADTESLTHGKTTQHDKYTVYFLFYMETKDSTPMFYFDGKWTSTFPKTSSGQDPWDGNNIVREGSLEGKRLQFYSISNEAYRNENGGYSFPGTNQNANTKFWNWMKSFK